MSREMEKLIVKRGAMLAELTSFNNFVASIRRNIEQGISIDDTLYCELNIRVNQIDKLLQEFEDIQTSIECSSKSDNIEEQYLERAKLTDNYFSSIAIAKNMLANTNKNLANSSESFNV